MVKLPKSIERVVRTLSRLPSIGPRQGLRLAFHLIRKGPHTLEELSSDLKALANVKTCKQCFFVHEEAGPLCGVCTDPGRNKNIIMIIEKETDLLSIEQTGKFTGRYLVIGEISKTGMLEEWQKLRIKSLEAFIKKELGGTAHEIVLGFNPSAVGDFNASILSKELLPLAERLTRLGRGLPLGGEIEFADEETLGSALERRT